MGILTWVTVVDNDGCSLESDIKMVCTQLEQAGFIVLCSDIATRTAEITLRNAAHSNLDSFLKDCALLRDQFVIVIEEDCEDSRLVKAPATERKAGE